MNDKLNIQTILGYVANVNPLRASRDGREFEGIIPAPTWTEEIVKRDGSVTNTVSEMRKIIKHFAWQAAKVAPLMQGKTLYDTCQNIWDFLFEHIRYKEDTAGKEELRTFARSFAQRRTGVDCDDFSIAGGSILYFLNIPFYIRIARYEGVEHFQHVYIIVPLKDKEYITIDGVLDEYDAEKPPVEFKDFLVMDNQDLNGIDISVLGSAQDDSLNEISGILTGADFEEVGNLEGLGRIASRSQELNAIRNHLMRTRNLIVSRPELIRESEHPDTFLGMVDYALKYWDTDKRDEALGILSGEEDRQNELSGATNYPEGHESIDLFYGLNDEGTYDVLGKAKKEKKFFSKVKAATKKAGTGIKKISKGVVRYNPVTASIRAAVLLALKVNLLKVSSKLKWGFLTQSEAQAHGFDLSEWSKVKKQLAVAERLFVNTLQGKAENFKRAIITGRAGGLSGTDLGLGVAVAATSTAAAVPFVTKILSLLKNINYKKLLAKINVSKLIKGRKQAETDIPTQDGESAVPENNESETPEQTTTTNINTGENRPPSDNAEQNEDVSIKISNTPASKKTTGANTPAENSGENKEEKTGEDPTNTDNLPAVSETARTAAEVAKTGGEPNIFTKSFDWVKENPKTSVLIGAGAAFIIYEMIKPKHALAGVRGKGKKKTGKAKTDPPHTISGTPKKAAAKKKAKGAAKKQIKL